MREFIKRLNKEKGVTVFLTTHYMAEADYLCNRVAIIDKGRIVALDTPKKLKRRLKKENVIEMDVIGLKVKVLNEIKKLDGVKGITYREHELRLIIKDMGLLDEVLKILKRNKVKFYSIHTEEPSLEDVFLYLTGRELK